MKISLQVRLDPGNKEIDLDSLMYGRITQLNEEEMKKQEGDYIYRYRYNGGGASQVWLGSSRYCWFFSCVTLDIEIVILVSTEKIANCALKKSALYTK